jgi:hypothetical protein
MHWYLLVMLRLDPEGRKERLREISPLYQPMILQQLSQWDQLPADMRQALLEKESFLRTYVEWQGHSASGKEAIYSRFSPEQRTRWSQELTRWQSLPPHQRAELCDAFRRFLYSTDGERKQTVQALSDVERHQMEQTLQSYGSLPFALQRQCVESFSKFATMSPEERSQFLQNAAEWEAMSAHERETWRMLVNHLPPLPPDFYKSNLPPMPPSWPLPPMPGTSSSPTPPTLPVTTQAAR